MLYLYVSSHTVCVCCVCTEIDNCASQPCVHGECTSAVGEYWCTCDEGWTGDKCDQGKVGNNYFVGVGDEIFVDMKWLDF